VIDLTFAANFLLQFAISNSVVAGPLALAALLVQRYAQRPALSHLLWLIVLLKLATPPLVSLPIVAISSQQAGLLPALVGTAVSAHSSAPDAGMLMQINASWPLLFVTIWLAGTLAMCGWSARQARHFDRLLRVTSKAADASLQFQAASLAQSMSLKCMSPILITSANISPMVWWLGGNARIYLPSSMIDSLARHELRSVLAHEMGHVARGDHFVRWLECFVCVLLWWNPLAWWARKNLRICEEVCCDAYVLSRTETRPDAYAGALVSAMEILARPPVYPGVPASRITGGTIERRIRMIVSGESLNQTPRWARGLILAGGVLALPFGCSLIQEQGALEQPEQAETGTAIAGVVNVILDPDMPANQIRVEMNYVDPDDGNAEVKVFQLGAVIDSADESAEVSLDVQPGAPNEVEPNESE